MGITVVIADDHFMSQSETRASGPKKAKRRMRAPERRAQLLEVARKVFGNSGFHGVSMEEVAKEAGITKPILYDHFSSRDLYLALLDEDLADLLAKVREALESPVGNRERIRRSFQTYGTWWIRQAISRAIADQSRLMRRRA